jgi:hypothetical protein
MVEPWVQELLKLGIGKVAIQTLALIDAGIEPERVETCPYCKTPVKKWARECGKCRKAF